MGFDHLRPKFPEERQASGATQKTVYLRAK